MLSMIEVGINYSESYIIESSGNIAQINQTNKKLSMYIFVII